MWEGNLSSCVTILTSVGVAGKTCRTQRGDAAAAQAVHGAILNSYHKLSFLQQQQVQQPTDLSEVHHRDCGQQHCQPAELPGLDVPGLNSPLYVQCDRHLQLPSQLSKTDWAEEADTIADYVHGGKYRLQTYI